MRLTRLFSGVVFLGVLGFGGYYFLKWDKNPQKSQEGTKILGKVTRKDMLVKVTASGLIYPNKRALITPPYNGYVKKLFVKLGDHVKINDPLVSVAQSISSGEEVFPLRASMNGMVVQINKDEGEYVATQSFQEKDSYGLIKIDDLTKIFCKADVPETEVLKLTLGQGAYIKLLANPYKTYKGKITELSLSSKSQDNYERGKVEFPIVVQVLDPDDSIMTGMSALLDIIVEEAKHTLTLNHEFIQKDESGTFYVVKSNGEKQPIEVGLQNEEAFEIKNGLSEGEEVKQSEFL